VLDGAAPLIVMFAFSVVLALLLITRSASLPLLFLAAHTDSSG
jgi:hypothetical protein